MLAVGIQPTEREKVTDTMEPNQELETVTHARIGKKPVTTITSNDPNNSPKFFGSLLNGNSYFTNNNIQPG